MINFEGRKEVFRALFGSYNYNLNTNGSDKDYKVFIVPTFDDLYFNKQFSKSYIGEVEDLDCHDIRKIPNLWWKSNVNFVEILFSKEIHINPEISAETKELVEAIFRNKDEFAKMNLPYLYNACVGMHMSKKKLIDKGTEGTQHLVDKFGYDTKQALHSIRILNFLQRFADTNFSDFQSAIKYDDNDDFRKLLLDIKAGAYSKEEFLDIADSILNEIEQKYKSVYLSKSPNEATYEKLVKIIKKIVQNELS